MFLKMLRIISGAALTVLGALWAFLVMKLLSGLVTGGVNGARGNLHRMLLENTLWEHTHLDPLVAVSRGYETMLLGLLVTWALREIYAYAASRATRN